MLTISAVRRLRQEDRYEFQGIMDYRVTVSQNQTKSNKKEQQQQKPYIKQKQFFPHVFLK